MSRLTRVVGGFSLDAVCFSDGEYEVDRPGGNGFWASMGVVLAGGAAAVHSVIGRDYPEEAVRRLRDCGVDTGGVRRMADVASLRVSFSYGSDESRHHPADPAAIADLPPEDRARFIDTTHREDLLMATLPSGTELVSTRADAWYLGLLPARRLRETVNAAGASGVVVLDCPDRSEVARDGNAALRDVLPDVDLFLPSTSDAAVFVPGVDERLLPSMFHDWGSTAVVLKCGSRGAVISTGARRWHVPVFVDSNAFDSTGAGDVFGGACASVMGATGDLVSAVVAGATSASFATAASTPLELALVAPDEYETRRRFIADRVEEL